MQRKLTSTTTLDNLKKEAKRWLKALRENDAEARERLTRAYPTASETPVLRDVQHALAREYGLAGWNELKAAVEGAAVRAATPADLVTRFLEYACPDHHVRSAPAHRVASHAAMRLLDEHPEIARGNLYTAVVCGEVGEVARILRERPSVADARPQATGRKRSDAGGSWDFLEDFGSKDWTPLLFLCFMRLPLARANENALEIARMLLDAGADPNAYFMAGDSRYTPLTGAIGEGEENRPPHPRRDELARLLLERGAEPYDGQVIYNIHFHGKVLWWLKLMYEFSVKAGRSAQWADPEWHMLDQGGYGSGARWHLRTAVENNDLELAEWCLAHGATPNAAPETSPHFSKRSLYEQAVRLGHAGLAELLARHGAERVDVVLDDEDAYVAATLRGDRAAAERLLAAHPEYSESSKALFEAAQRNRADAIALLLELGTPLEVVDESGQRALHVAAYANAVDAVKLLLERGAEIDVRERNHMNTALGFAVYAGNEAAIELLAPHSRDVWELTPLGRVERLREVLTAEPRLARETWRTTPLFWLPDDEDAAGETVKLFLDHGADAAFRSEKDGSTAAEIARRRGLTRAAELLEAAAGVTGDRGEYMRFVYEAAARDLVSVCGRDDEEALGRLARQFDRALTFDQVRKIVGQRLGRPEGPIGIEDARELVAKQAGFESWAAFLQSFGERPRPVSGYDGVAEAWVAAYEGDAAALERLNAYYGRQFTLDDLKAEIWRRVYAFRQRSSRVPKNFLKLEEAQVIVAQDAGFPSWEALHTGAAPVAAFEIDAKENRAAPRRRMGDGEWEELVAAMKEQRVTALDAQGLMTDAAMARVAELDHVTGLNLGGSRELSDDGLLQLARMPQLEALNLSEYPGGKLTDRGLEVLRSLPNLRRFEMTWQAGITDAGVANLRYCENLENVNVMGSPTGDGVIEALAGKARLRSFSTGRLTTDAGLAELPAIPALERLLIDGPFSDDGLAGIAELERVVDLDLFWHVENVTGAGFAHLARMPGLEKLGCDGRLSGDVAMAHIGRMPRLKHLRAQESAATDEGFVALARSKTLEGFWGRSSEGFGDGGFRAFSKMPALRSLGVSLAKVSEEALALLPDFPALRELTPIGLKDDGFRHVGRCSRLERLTCMYCRESGDAATEHIARLPLKYYYAGLTQITDRTLEILGRMESLEQVDLYECKGVTDAGLAFLARLPRLREVHVDGCPGMTLEGTKVFGEGVRVAYTT
jgi:ankyrin repeat protein